MNKSIDYHLTIKSAPFMRQKCSILNVFKIIGFCHDMSFQHGELSMLTTNENVFRTWSKYKLPAIFTNESGRILAPGIYLGTTLDEKDKITRKTRSYFLAEHSANQSLHILEHDNNCQHLFSFLFNKSQSEFLQWTINNIYLLQNFITNYKNSAQELIYEAKKSINRICLPIHEIKNPVITKLVANKKIIHKDSKIPIYLAKQQSICLTFLFEGMSAKEIATKMNLSFRTVQHYIVRIRQLLGCKSNKELLIKYNHQFN